MSRLGWGEIVIIIAVIAVLILLPKKLPQLGSSMGKSIRSFRKGIKEGKDELKSAVSDVSEGTGLDEIKGSAKEIRQSISLKDAPTDKPGPNGSSPK